MNEEELAGLLDEYLNKLLDGQAIAAAPPTELADLLALALDLTAAAPLPRPEFATALRASLISTTGGAGIVGTGAPALGSKLSFLVIVSVIALVAALIIGAIIFRASRMVDQPVPTATALPATTAATPEPPTSTVAPTATTVEVVPTPLPTETATPMIDIIPTIIVTVVVDSPIDLAPGEPAPANSDGGNDQNNQGDEGDHDRGHGNDPDHHDEDNPGQSGKK